MNNNSTIVPNYQNLKGKYYNEEDIESLSNLRL